MGYRYATRRTGKARNPFRNAYRRMVLIVLPILSAGVALVLLYLGPNVDAFFGWNPVHGKASDAHWCAEVNLDQATPELQAYADYILTTREYADWCFNK